MDKGVKLLKPLESQYGDPIFFRPVSWFGHVVRFFDNLRAPRGKKCPFCHTASVLFAVAGRVVFIESIARGGVRIGVLDTRLNNFTIGRSPVPPRPIEETLAMVGVPYDYGRIRHLLVCYLLNRKPSWDYNAELICAALTNYITPLIPDGAVTPRTMWNAWLKAKTG